MKKVSLELTMVELVTNTQEVTVWKKGKMYKNSFEFLGDVPFPIEEVELLKWRIPPPDHYRIYRISTNKDLKDHTLHVFIATKNWLQDLQFNFLLRKCWFQKLDYWKFIIPTIIALCSLSLSIYNLWFK